MHMHTHRAIKTQLFDTAYSEREHSAWCLLTAADTGIWERGRNFPLPSLVSTHFLSS